MNSPTQNSLTIFLWNANGLNRQSQRDELTVLLQEKRIDIALITETHFTSRSYLYITNYTTYRTDHPDDTAHGGSAILIRNTVSHYHIPSDPTDFIQATTISISTLSSRFTVAAVYCPPNKPISQQQFLSFFNSLGTKFICGGDFNSKHPQWGCRVSNPRGSTLLHSLSTTNYQVLSPPEPTYWPTSLSKLPDILDFFITSPLSSVHNQILNLYDLSSDHSPVLLILDTKPITSPPKPRLINGRVDWESFRQGLESRLDLQILLKTPQEIDDAVNFLTETIQRTIWDCTTPYPQKRPYYLSLTIRQLITEKRRARARWQRTRYPTDKTNFNRLARRLTLILKQDRLERYNEHTASLTNTDGSLWNATRRILSYKITSPPLRQSNNIWAKTDEEKASVFGSHLSKIFTPHPDVQDFTHIASIENSLLQPLPLSLPPKAFHPSDIIFIINRLKMRKAPGYDLITTEILKQLPKKAILFLTHIYNSVLRTTYFPLLWKHSEIIMIRKPKKPSHIPSSYRPISLLPVMGKILERLILNRISPILNSKNIIPHHQFGFRSLHSTVLQCHRIVDLISTSLEQKQYCPAVFLDVEQAFDRVWHSGLLSKLKCILPSTYYLIFKSFLANRFYRVRQGSAFSSYFPVQAGVPQGSILGPILYTVYTSDIPQHPSTTLASFADDTAILSRHTDPSTATNFIQHHLYLIETWARKWRLKINSSKSVNITFTLRRGYSPPLYLNNILIPSSDITRYLGLHLDKRLTWNPHTKLKRQDMNRRYKLLLRLLDTRSKLTLENKLLIYKAIIRPIWTYGLELWGSTKPSNSYRIQILQSRILRKITDAPFYVSNLSLHLDLQIPFVKDLAKSRYSLFKSTFSSHPNPLVRSLGSSTLPDNPRRRLKRTWPRDLL